MDESSHRWQVLIQRRPERTLHQLPDDRLNQVSAALHQFGTIVARGAMQGSPEGLASAGAPIGSLELTGYGNMWFIDVYNWRIIYAIEESRRVILIVDVSPLRGL